MAITIPDWIPKFIDQVVAYRERQQVTHERLNELFNLLVVQGDFNTNTLQTLNDNLAAFDLQYLTDVGANTTAHQSMLDNFTAAVNQMKSDNTIAITNLDTQQKQLMATMLADFEAELTATETAINTELATKLATIQTLHDEMINQAATFDADMATLTNTVETLRSDILADNEAIALQVQTTKTEIEVMLSTSQGIVQNAETIIAATSQANTYKKAGGTGTAITLALNSVTAYYAGMAVHLVALADNGAVATTLKVDALATLPVYKLGTTTAPNIVLGKPYTFVVSEDLSHFFLVASAEGNAVAEHVLAGDIFSTDADTGVVGTMPNRGAVNQSLALNASYTIPAGYHNGTGVVNQALTTKGAQVYTPGTTDQTIAANQYLTGAQTIVGDADLVSTNIKAGINIFGIQGNANVVDTSAGDAIASQILSGAKAYVDGALVTGNIPSKGAATITPGTTNQTIAAGQYLSGIQTIAGDGDLIAANILNTANIFGVQGSVVAGKRTVSSSANAAAGVYLSFNKSDGQSFSAVYITGSGLGFTPSKIIAYVWVGGTNCHMVCADATTGYIIMTSGSSSTNDPGKFGLMGSSAYMDATGFRIPVPAATTFTWVAIE